MSFKKSTKWAFVIVILIVSIVVIYWNKKTTSPVTTVYVNDSSELKDKIIWDKDKKLVQPDLLNEILNTEDSLIEVDSKLNGVVFYRLDKSLKKQEVLKVDYQKEEFYVKLNNDTISMGDTVRIEIGVTNLNNNNYKIDVRDTELYELESSEYDKGKTFVYRSFDFDSTGIYSFNSLISIDGDSLLINYNYFVQK